MLEKLELNDINEELKNKKKKKKKKKKTLELTSNFRIAL
jgi:hypothetical protein